MARNYYAEINLHVVWHTKGSARLLEPKVEAVVQHYLRGRCINTEGVYIHEIGGIEVFEALKRDRNTARIPVLVLADRQLSAEDRLQLNSLVQSVRGKSDSQADR